MALRPLDGVRVLDLTRFPPGAFCTVLLADLGADVCRLEPPGNSAMMSGIGVGLGRNKRSVSVDLRNPQGLAVLRRLAAWADVLVENNRPGELDERGFGYSHAATELPGLIWCSITGFGQDGPNALLPGHDISYVAHSGLLQAINPALPWHPQLIMSIPVAAALASTAILGALRHRDRSGAGCQIDISLAEAATWMLTSDDGMLNGAPRGIPVTPDRHLYECSDGRWVATACSEPKTWRGMCTGLGCDDLVDTLWRWPDMGAVVERFANVFRTQSAAHWVSALTGAGAAIVHVNTGTDLQFDAHAQARGTLQNVDGTWVPGSPIRYRDADGAISPDASRPPVGAGVDTDVILAEAGYAANEIAELRAAGAIAG